MTRHSGATRSLLVCPLRVSGAMPLVAVGALCVSEPLFGGVADPLSPLSGGLVNAEEPTSASYTKNFYPGGVGYRKV